MTGMSGLAAELHWDEPDAGCVSCGQPHLTISDHRCGTCIDQPVAHCPHCLGDIAALIDREVTRRLRQASWDVAQAWVEIGQARRIDQAATATAARSIEAAERRAHDLQARLRGAA